MKTLKQILNEVIGNEPNVYYHVTTPDKLKKIKKFGVTRREKGEWKGMFGQDIREKKGVFVFDNLYDAQGWAFKTCWDRKINRCYILKLKTTDTDFEEDSHWEASSAVGKWLVKQTNFESDELIDIIEFDITKWTAEDTLKLNKAKEQIRNKINEIDMLDQGFLQATPVKIKKKNT